MPEPKIACCDIHSSHDLSEHHTGIEWIIDAHGCDPTHLRNVEVISELCDQLVVDLGLNVLGEPLRHQFPPPGGVTSLYMLSESHLACHTYPEFRLATFNLYCCRIRPPWDWNANLRNVLGAQRVQIREVRRGNGAGFELSANQSRSEV